MSKAPKQPDKVDVRLVLIAAGTIRSEADLRKDVTQALEEATEEFRRQRGISDLRTEGTPQGGFLGLGAEWAWIISVLSPIAWELVKEAAKAGAEEAGKEGAKSLFSLIKNALRKRNISTTAPEPLTGPTSSPSLKATATGSKNGPAKKKQGHTAKKGARRQH